MKVITEEKLMNYIKSSGIVASVYASSLNNLLEEIDTLAVSKLRPMSEAPRDGSSFLVCFNGSETLNEGYFDSIGNIWVGELYDKPENFEGWVPMPEYKPVPAQT